MRFMRRRLAYITAISLTLALTGCSGAATPNAIPTSVAATVEAIHAAHAGVTATGEVVPAQTADMSFVISAPVKQVLVSEGDAVHAGQSLIVLDAPDLSYAQIAAAADLKSKQDENYIQSQGRRKWNGFKFVWVAGPPEQRREAEARVVQAQAALNVAQAQLAQATLVAPFDGTVVQINARPGEIVQPGEVVLVIGALDHLRVETTDLSERAIARVHVGQRVLLHLKAFATPLGGMVTALLPKAGKSADGDIIYKAIIELDQQPPELRWGMTGDVEFNLDQ
jgi:RND family efflux transporter MFP subunit